MRLRKFKDNIIIEGKSITLVSVSYIREDTVMLSNGLEIHCSELETINRGGIVILSKDRTRGFQKPNVRVRGKFSQQHVNLIVNEWSKDRLFNE